ncbi:MAG: aryl-sulfate sulfotransferase [Bryobacteraceae bacterium]
MKKRLLFLTTLLGLSSLPAFCAVAISSVTPSPASPQPIGTPITWTATATDSGAGPLTFQFSVTAPGGVSAIVADFNAGTLSSGIWTSQPFVWTPTGIEGTYQIKVVAKDFGAGLSTTKAVQFTVNPLVTGTTPVVVATANPLVALFSAPSCPTGSTMRVSFQQQSGATAAVTTNYLTCRSQTMTFEIAGLFPSTAYKMFSQTNTGGTITNGPTITFTTGPLPTGISFPSFTVKIPAGSHSDKTDSMLLLNPIKFGGGAAYPVVATNLSGKIMWYYYQAGTSTHYVELTRPLQNGNMLTIQDGPAWNPATQQSQLLREIDVAGNIIHETNTGIIQQQLLAKGATDAQACSAIAKPAPVGSACLGSFHHEAIQTLPSGQTAVIADIERIFPAGTQGDTSGLPVDIVGDMIIVLNSNWQVAWYWDSFQHDGGGTQLDINRPAVLGETCIVNEQGCPPMLLLGSGIAPTAKDWLHANSLYYWATDTLGSASKDLVWSSKNQDWLMKIDYNNGAGTGNILWRMGPCGDFTFNNINNDPWPWFSHQHEASLEKNGAGPLTMFDNGDTRVSTSSVCEAGSGSGNSRGMALTVNESTMQVTPVLSQDLGVYSPANGSAQLLSNGDYYFFPGAVLVNLSETSNSIEIFPTAGTTGGTQVLNIQGPDAYRGWQIHNLYTPPTT